MEKTALWRIVQPNGHIKCPDRQILFHSVTDGPTHDTAALQIENDGKIKPAFMCPDIDVASPLLVGRIGNKIAVESVGCNTQAMVAVRDYLVPGGAETEIA